MSQCPSHTRCSQLHKLCLLSVTLIFSPLFMLLIRLCRGLIYDCPFSRDTPHPPTPLSSLWSMRNTQAEVPGSGCHPPSAPVCIWDWTIPPSQPFEQHWLPALSLLSRLTRMPQFQSYPLFPLNRENPSFLGRISCFCRVWCFQSSLLPPES